MFKLNELSVGFFAIVKANQKAFDMPVTVHGFIEVVGDSDTAILLNGEMSKELAESNEVESLKKEALELTIETVADEFFD